MRVSLQTLKGLERPCQSSSHRFYNLNMLGAQPMTLNGGSMQKKKHSGLMEKAGVNRVYVYRTF